MKYLALALLLTTTISALGACSAGSSGSTSSNQFVTLGRTGVTSPDGYNYTYHGSTPEISGFANQLIYVNNQFVAVGANESGLITGMVATSSNGIAFWQTQLNYPVLNTITYGFGKYLAGGQESTLIYSTNLSNWQQATINPAPTASINFSAIQCNSNICYALANRLGNGYIYSSADGINWNLVNNFTSNNPLNALAVESNTFVAVGNHGTIAYNNGSGWTQLATSPTNKQLLGIAYGNGNFVIVGGGDANPLLSFSQVILQNSGNLDTWNIVYSGDEVMHTLNSVVYANNRFAVVGEGLITILPDDTVGYSTTGASGTWNLHHLATLSSSTLAYGTVSY